KHAMMPITRGYAYHLDPSHGGRISKGWGYGHDRFASWPRTLLFYARSPPFWTAPRGSRHPHRTYGYGSGAAQPRVLPKRRLPSREHRGSSLRSTVLWGR